MKEESKEEILERGRRKRYVNGEEKQGSNGDGMEKGG